VSHSPESHAPSDGTDWSNIENIRAEWPAAQLDPQADLEKWQLGVALYNNDDYPSMMECASLLPTALAHHLYGEGLLRGEAFPDTMFKTLYASLSKPPDGQTFAPVARRAVRLVLTLLRENGLQPKSMRGQGLLPEEFMMDKGNYMLMSMAVAPNADRPWEGRLEPFFAVPPQPSVASLPDSTREDGNRTVDRMYATMQEAEAGDPASEAHMTGMGLWLNGHPEEGLAALSEAAKLGSVDAMKDAGDLAQELGRPGEARFWFESAANAGHSGAMWNMAVFAYEANDLDGAATWHQRAAEAGLADSYAALTQMARDSDDPTALRHWARLGAEAGQTFCIVFHGMHLMMDANGDIPMIRQARDYLEQAAERGDIGAAAMAVNANVDLGDQARADRFTEMVVGSGDQEEIDRLRRYGYL
jgi:hypothetical protein